jgi:hypothetical protein
MRTLTVNEVNEVSGGAFWTPVVVAAARCAASTQCRNAVQATGVVILGAIAYKVGYENN